MRTYEATIKLLPIYGNERATTEIIKVDAGKFRVAGARALAVFGARHRLPDRVGRSVSMVLVRVI